MKEIKLSRGFVAYIDDVDFSLISKHTWHVHISKRNKYACTNVKIFGKHSCPRMHRLIMDPPMGLDVDHINGNGLDNRRSNLRIVTRSQNMANCRSHRDSTSKFKGVFWDKDAKRWRACLCHSGHTIEIGRFKDEQEAANNYDDFALFIFRENARLNKEAI